MTTYKNDYFNIKVEFPFDWKVSCRSNSNLLADVELKKQSTDEDLPKENGDYKTLLMASLSVEGSQSMLSSKFSIIVHRRIDGFDLLNEAKQKSDLIECENKSIKFLGREAQEIKIVQNVGDYNLITKVIAWEESPDIWISVIVEGDSLQNFLTAEEMLNKVVRI